MRTDIIADLRDKLPHKRFLHSEGVAQTVVRLAERYGIDADKAELAGWLHDCARIYPTDALVKECMKRDIRIARIEEESPILLHAPLGVYLAKHTYGIDDEEILDAIACHTVGRENMTVLDMIVYLADMIEPTRDYDGVEVLRELADKDLKKAMVAAFDQSIKHVVDQGGLLHPNTILARNELLMHG